MGKPLRPHRELRSLPRSSVSASPRSARTLWEGASVRDGVRTGAVWASRYAPIASFAPSHVAARPQTCVRPRPCGRERVRKPAFAPDLVGGSVSSRRRPDMRCMGKPLRAHRELRSLPRLGCVAATSRGGSGNKTKKGRVADARRPKDLTKGMMKKSKYSCALRRGFAR
jgi:hypothetical protein